MMGDTKLKVVFFPNGNTAVFRNGQQVAALQESWFMLYVHLLAAMEIDPTEVEFVMPDANRAQVLEEEGALTWRIEKKVEG